MRVTTPGITGPHILTICVLVLMGVDDKGKKHLISIEDGVRESTQSWREVLLGAKARG